MTRLLIAALLFCTPAYALDCKKEWVQACVGSDQDKYRNWKPPKMHTLKEQAEIMRKGKHICEYTNKGKCADWKPIKVKQKVEYEEGVYE